MSIYRPISELLCFSKFLQRIMYNRAYEFLAENKILYDKQFGYPSSPSTKHAILQHSNRISNSFNETEVTIGAFIDFSKAFDMVDDKILIKI